MLYARASLAAAEKPQQRLPRRERSERPVKRKCFYRLAAKAKDGMPIGKKRRNPPGRLRDQERLVEL
jgi:hypothetical protein